MANNEINGRDVIVMIDPAGGSSYVNVVCLTSNTITNTLTELDASSKCGNKFIQGQKFDSTITGEGFVIDPDTGTPTDKGYNDLYTLFKNRSIVGIKFGKAAPTTGDAVYTGTAFITQLEQVAADDELVTFSITFKCAAPPFDQTITY